MNTFDTLQQLAPTLPVDEQSLADARTRLDSLLGSDAATAVHVAEQPRLVAISEVRRRRRANPYLAAAAAAVCAGVVIFSQLATPLAPAAWSAVPATVSAPRAAAIARACAHQEWLLGEGFSDAEGQTLAGTWRLDPANSAYARYDGAVPLVAERRGDVEAVVFDLGGWNGTCMLVEGRSLLSISFAPASIPAPPDGELELLTSGGGVTEFGSTQWITGVVGEGVTDVSITLPSGQDVEASLANGRFTAWWPDAVDPDDRAIMSDVATVRWVRADGSVADVSLAQLVDGAPLPSMWAHYVPIAEMTWTADASPMPNADRERFSTWCRARASLGGTERPWDGSDADLLHIADGELLVVEERGDIVLGIARAGTALSVCGTGPTGPFGGGSSDAAASVAAAAPVGVVTHGTRWDDSGEMHTLAGFAEEGTTNLTVRLADGSRLHPTVEGEYFVAWWVQAVGAGDAVLTWTSPDGVTHEVPVSE